MLMHLIIVLLSIILPSQSFQKIPQTKKFFKSSLYLKEASNDLELFGGTKVVKDPIIEKHENALSNSQSDRFKLEAQKLRKEAAELEVALREEARSKGIPEDMINKLVPIQQNTQKIKAENLEEKIIEKKSADLIRSKLGFLSIGEPVRFVTDLQRIKSRGYLNLWDSFELDSNYNVNDYQLKSKTSIDPIKLRLDDVGYDYKQVLVIAFIVGTSFGLLSSYIGGQLGFLLGYLSALLPISLVGIGSIAPALIGDVLLLIQCTINTESRDKFIHLNAGKFLVGYVLGLPLARFDSGAICNTVEFFQLRPSGASEDAEKKFFTKKAYTQNEIARSSAVCISGPVTECIYFGESSGTAANDVNTLQQLMLAIEPTLKPESVQNHIRWSAVTAFNILTKYKMVFPNLVNAFREKQSLETCISIIESTDDN